MIKSCKPDRGEEKESVVSKRNMCKESVVRTRPGATAHTCNSNYLGGRDG
jgi:hypothetical protein